MNQRRWVAACVVAGLLLFGFNARANVTCWLCGVRMAGGYHTLDDGRYLCAKDFPNVILDQRVADEIFAKAKGWCHTTLAGYGSLPDENIHFSLLNKTAFDATNRTVAAQHPEAHIVGMTRSQSMPSGAIEHFIFMLSGRMPPAFKSTCVHEYGHTWLGENARAHKLTLDGKEGFCEWLAYKFEGEQGNDRAQKEMIKAAYSHGQLEAFAAAEKAHSFAEVIEWAKNGADGQIDPKNLDRILVLHEGTLATARPRKSDAPLQPFAAMPVFAPIVYTNLVLKSVSGAANRRFALINNQTFSRQETGKVHLGGSNVVLRCMEIEDTYAVVQIQGDMEMLRLPLRGGRN